MAAVGPWIRVVILTAEAVAETAALYLQHFERQEVQPAWEGRKLHVYFERQVSSGGPVERQMITQHFVNLTEDAVDNSWTDEDFLVVEGAWNTRWGQLKPIYHSSLKLAEYRWYRFGPNVGTPNPAVRSVAKDVPGTGTAGGLPPQVAISVTERTPLRKRWGRFYLPAPTETISSDFGRLDTGQPAAIASEIADLYQTCRDADIIPVVWSPTIEAAFSVQQVQVDDVFDVIRSRRYQGVNVRAKAPV